VIIAEKCYPGIKAFNWLDIPEKLTNRDYFRPPEAGIQIQKPAYNKKKINF
jgi:hypothetical protein